MVKFKAIIKDAGFWSLFIINMILLINYIEGITNFNTLLWCYWWQSVIIGIFNFIRMRTLKQYDVTDLKINDKPVDKKSDVKGCMSRFFLFHYGFFHFGYFIFLITGLFTKNVEVVNFNYVLTAIIGFFISSLMGYIHNHRKDIEGMPNIGTLMFQPYIRIIPMHFCIMASAFFTMKYTGIIVFISLKIIADGITYSMTHKPWKPKTIIDGTPDIPTI